MKPAHPVGQGFNREAEENRGIPGEKCTQWVKCIYVSDTMAHGCQFYLSRAREPLFQYDFETVFYPGILKIIYPRFLTYCHPCAKVSDT